VVTVKQLREIARERIRDAEALFNAKRYDGSMYICGYAVEIALKARICRTLRWPDYPQTNRDWNQNKKFNQFKTHSLSFLLSFTGREDQIKSRHSAEWDLIDVWDPNSRYKPTSVSGRATKSAAQAKLRADARQMIDSAKILLKAL
jgi:HEPN domain-containing protein